MTVTITAPTARAASVATTTAALSWLALLQILVIEAVTAASWRGHYSRTDQPLSDLGVRVCDDLGSCSTSTLMNVSIALGGILLAVGAFGFAFARRIPWMVAAFFGVAAGGLLLVALFPLSTPSPLHALGAHAFFSLSGAGLAVAAAALFTRTLFTRTQFTRNHSASLRIAAVGVIAISAVSMAAALLFSADMFGPLGLGGMQRTIIYSSLLGFATLAGALWHEDRSGVSDTDSVSSPVSTESSR